MKLKKILKNNIAIISGLSLIAGSFTGLYFLGKSYIENAKYDFVMGINRKDNLNYTTSSGEVTRIALNFQEGIVTNNITDLASQNLINDKSAWGDEELRSEYESFIEKEAIKRVEDINDDRGTETEIEGQELSLNGFKFSIVDEGWVNTNNTEFKFFMREDLEWSTGEKIKPSDFGFALYNILNAREASAARYMSSKYIDLKNTSIWEKHQNEAISNDEDEDWEILEKLFFDEANPTKNVITGSANKGNKSEAAFVFNNDEGWLKYQTNSPNPEFASLLQNPTFLPVNQVWLQNRNMTVRDMGTSANKLSTYGAFNVSKFDPAYGVELIKNENYHNKDLIPSNSMLFRTIKEQSTQLSMFKSGELSAFHPDEVTDKSTLINDSTGRKFADWQLGNPTTRYMLFNLAPNNERPSAKYYKNENFRKALFYAFDRSIWSAISGNERAVPTTTITPSNFSSFKDITNDETERTIVDYTYNAKIDINQKEKYLNAFDEEARLKILNTEQKDLDKMNYERGTTEGESTNSSDPSTDLELSQYFWDLFLLDMEAINVSIPDGGIELEYLTENGDSDTVIQALRQSLAKTDIPVTIKIETIVGSSVPAWRAGNYDMIEIGWNPDIASPWGSLSIYNGVDLQRNFNLSVAWNFWTGSWHTYGNTYEEDQLEKIYQNWSFDGLFKPTSFKPSSNSDWTLNEDILNVIPDEITAEKEGGIVIMNGIHDFLENSINISDEPSETGSLNVNIDGGKGEDNGYETDIVSGTTQTEIFGLDEQDQARFFIALEAINQEGLGSLQFRNALPNSVPNRSPFMSSISQGYPIQIYLFNPNLKNELGYPSVEDILGHR